MTSLQRVLTTLNHQEPDRVPLFLLVTMHGAKELGLSIQEYFSKAENVVEGQLRLQKKYRNDCIYSFFYASLEVEAWGTEIIYSEDGPPNSGRPFISKPEKIKYLEPPDIKKSPCLTKALTATQIFKQKVGNDIPIIATVISPFSLPVMQMGFDKYLELMYERPDLFERLMQINEEFCVQWANAQLKAGATAICYVDPVSSPTITSKASYMLTGFKIAQRTLPRIKGYTATHFASGRSLPILEAVAQTGTAMVGVSVSEDLTKIKAACQDKLTILGNLNGVEMRTWTSHQAETIVKEAIYKAGAGGGYILADNHGEIPWQVPEEVLMAISEAVHKWGHYPLTWRGEYAATNS